MNKKLQKLSSTGPVPLLLFSGGLDSTWLLANMLETTDVDILYVTGPQLGAKAVAEQAAQKRILAWVKKNRPYSVRNVFDMQTGNGVPVGVQYRFAQVLPWFYAAMTHATADRHTRVIIAYVQGDGVARHLTELRWAWDYLKVVVMERPVELTFPLQDCSKADLIDTIPADLYKLIWFCETPVKRKQCGFCTPCITHKVERLRLELTKQSKEQT